jgi:hypothetical protein
MPKFLVVQ